MNRLFYNIKYDIRLLFVTKAFTFLFLSLIGIFLLSQYNQINKFKMLTNQYNISYEEIKNAGENPDELLNKEYHIEEKVDQNGRVAQYIDNHLRYDFEAMKESRNDISGSNIVISLLKNSILVFLSLIACIYMIFVACLEFSESTFKSRLLMGSSLTIISSKMIAGIITFSIAYFLSLIISSAISFIWTQIATNPYSLLHDITYPSIVEIIRLVLLSYLILIIYTLIAFSLGMFMRKTSLAIIFVFVAHLIFPSLGKYDYKNVVLTIYDNIFGVSIDSSINYIRGMSVLSSFLILVCYSVVVIALAFLRFKIDKKNGVMI